MLSTESLELVLWLDTSDPLLEILTTQLWYPVDARCREMQILYRIG